MELPIAEAEVWLKSGRMEDARRLGPIRRAICAMPSDVAKHELSATIEELPAHNRIAHRVVNGQVICRSSILICH